MAAGKPDALTRLHYLEAAEAYLRALPPEHFMEATAQGTQRKITLESLDLVHASRKDVQLFNELLVQYPKRDGGIGQVVPDNMVVLHAEPIKADGSFDTIFQPTGPFWVLEYVSKHTRRKDYDDNMEKYERDLKVPYFLLFFPDTQDLTLYKYRRTKRKYASVPPDENGRHPIPELEMEVGLLEGWVRFWLHGELLLLPADLQRDLKETRRQLRAANRRADEAEQRAFTADRRADEEHRSRTAAEEELARLRAELARLR